jgi:hypothetical protein
MRVIFEQEENEDMRENSRDEDELLNNQYLVFLKERQMMVE